MTAAVNRCSWSRITDVKDWFSSSVAMEQLQFMAGIIKKGLKGLKNLTFLIFWFMNQRKYQLLVVEKLLDLGDKDLNLICIIIQMKQLCKNM